MAEKKLNIPLEPASTNFSTHESIGSLIKTTLEDSSQLIRGEVALIKTELSKQVVRAAIAIGLFLTSLTLILYSSFFFLFSMAKGLANFVPEWLGFLIIFLLMLLVSIIFIFIGIRLLRKLDGPQKSVKSLKETAQAFKGTAASQKSFSDRE